jgi:hypothetical protein
MNKIRFILMIPIVIILYTLMIVLIGVQKMAAWGIDQIDTFMRR